MPALIPYRIVDLPRRKVVEVAPATAKGSGDGAAVHTRLRLMEKAIAKGYHEGRITHLEVVELPALWQGQQLDEVVVVRRARCFYGRRRGIFVMEAPRDLAKRIVDRLNTGDVDLRPVRIDLARFVDRLPASATVLGAWSTARIPGNVRSRAVFGKDLGGLKEFQKMRTSGEVSSLSLRCPFGNRTLRVNVSRWGSALFFGAVDLETRLRFLEHLAAFEVGTAGAQRRGVGS